ncbi:hypothetical protein GCM10027168_04480 [Streptomyces capparidis]
MTPSPTPAELVYRLADPALYDALYERMRGETLQWLREEHGARGPLPGPFADWLRTRGDRAAVLALAECSRAWPEGEAELLEWLTALGDPVVGGHLLRRCGPGRVLAAICAAADPADPGWRAPGGLVESLLSGAYDTHGRLVPLLGAPFPEVVEHALRHLGSDLDAGAWLEACRTVLRHGGPEWLARLAGPAERADAPHTPPEAAFGAELARTLRAAAAAPDPGAVLDEAGRGFGAAPPPSGAPVAPFAVLRREYLAGRRLPPLDCHAVLREHRRKPFQDHALLTAAAGWAAAGGPSPEERAVLWEFLTGPPARTALLQPGLRDGWFPAERVFKEITPAFQVLTELTVAQAPPPEAADALAALVEPLGADPAAWVWAYAHMARFKGSCAELMAEAAERARRAPEPVWPRRTEAALPGREPEGARLALVALLSAAPEQAAIALAPHLDPRAVQQFLRYGRPTERVRDHLLSVHGRSAALAWAAHSRLPAEHRDFLLDMDDPDVNARLLRHAGLDRAARERILAGVPHRPGRTGTTPMSDDLAAAVAGYDGVDTRQWLMPAVSSGDPRVVRVLLGRVKLHTLAARLRVLVRLWERHGPHEVRALLDESTFPQRPSPKHPLPPTTRRIAERALAAPGDEGLALLRGELARAADPLTVAAWIVRRPATSVGTRLVQAREELGSVPLDGLAALHKAQPLPPEVLCALAGHEEDWPRELLLDLVRAATLQGVRLPVIVKALGDGRLSCEDLLTEARPARTALLLADETPEVLDAARGLARAELGADPETWAVATHLLPDFTGTVAELVRTAAAIMS